MKSALTVIGAVSLAFVVLAHSAPLAGYGEADLADAGLTALDGSDGSDSGTGTCQKKTGGGKSDVVGFIGIAAAGIGFGSNFVVIKNEKYNPGDGIFFQFNMVVGVFMTGMIYHYVIRGAPPLQPLAMLGGAGWAIGNAACPFIIDTIGMGLGLSIWGTANLLTGWSSAHFGILLVAKETVPKETLNVSALPVAVLAILIYAQVKNVDPAGEAGTAEEKRAMLGSINAPPPPKKANPVVGVIVACVAGVLFGACFNPAQHVIDQATANHCKQVTDECSCINYFDPDDRRIYCSWDPTAETKNGTTHGACMGMPGPDLAFSQFCGIFIASFSILVVVGFYKQFIKNEELYVNVPLILPGFLSGVIWAIAQIGWFVASDNLSMVVSFPIICTVPAILANFYGITIFNEIATDSVNLLKLFLGIACSAAAAILISLSKLS